MPTKSQNNKQRWFLGRSIEEQRKSYLPDNYYYNHVYTGRIFFDLIFISISQLRTKKYR